MQAYAKEPSLHTQLSALNRLGNHYLFFLEGKGSGYALNIAPVLDKVPVGDRKIDPVGIAEMVSSRFLLGDRTLVQGIKRTPWMAGLDREGRWEFSAPPQHGKREPPTDVVVRELKEALQREALSYVSGKRHVGILLSGGLDSRIVAGLVRELQLTHDFTGDAVALTWGLDESRDVVFAKEIARRYAWEWLHFPLGPEDLLENIHIAGRLGAEYSPLHLHALPRVREIEGIDAILVGSYGDSVGRAEFSGRHVLQLKPIVPPILNYLGLMPHRLVKAVRNTVLQDAYGYRERFPREKTWQYRELEQQMHYMRRKLQACMSYVAERIPLFQLFTSPECVSLMWSLDPSIRDNRYYEVLLPSLPGKVGSIPWARTGRPLGEPKGPTDKAPGLSHKYGVWLRRDLRTMITELAASDTIRELNLFNEQALNRLIRLWPRAQTTSTNRMDDIISWMASLAIFVKRYDIKPINTLSPSWRDGVNALSGVARAWAYQTVRGKLRR